MREVLYGVIIVLMSMGIVLIINGWRLRRRAASTDVNAAQAVSFDVSMPFSSRMARNRHYVANTTLLLPNEQQFALLLNDILPSEYCYSVRVALNRLVKVKQLRRTQAWRDARWSRIAQKSIDVVIMRASDTKPVLVLLFEDNRHGVAPTTRDVFLASVLHDVKLPVVYIASSTMHIREAIQHQIIPFLVQAGEGGI